MSVEIEELANSFRRRLVGAAMELREGTLILIGRGETHEIRNSDDVPLRTLNVYVPPVYSPTGEELPAGKA